MKQKSYQIKYSILVNGEEYPNSLVQLGIDSSDAENNLRARFKDSDAELVIIEVLAI